MSKTRHAKPNEFYEEQIKTLRSHNRALKKRLRQLEKNNHVREELKLDKEVDEEIERDNALAFKEPVLEQCPECSRHGIETVTIVGKLLKRCTICGYRSGVIK